MRIGKRELENEIIYLQAEVRRLKAELAAKEWQPLSSMPNKGPFLVAQYAPTSWVYRPTYIEPPYYMEGEALERHLRMQTRWARAWMPAPEPPGPHGTGWFEET